MKKVIVFLLVLTMILSLFVGCDGNNSESKPAPTGGSPGETVSEQNPTESGIRPTSPEGTYPSVTDSSVPSKEEPELKWESKELDFLAWLNAKVDFEVVDATPELEITRLVSPLVFNEDEVITNIQKLDRYSNTEVYKSFNEGGGFSYYDEWNSRIPQMSYKLTKDVNFAIGSSYVVECSYTQSPSRCQGITTMRVSIAGIKPEEDVQGICYETLKAAWGEELANYMVYTPGNGESYENPNTLNLYQSQHFGSDTPEREVTISSNRIFLYEYTGTWRVSFTVAYYPNEYKQYMGYHEGYVPLANSPEYTIQDVFNGRLGSLTDIFNASDAMIPFFEIDSVGLNERFVSSYSYSYRESPYAGPHTEYKVWVSKHNSNLNDDSVTSNSFMYSYEVDRNKDGSISELNYGLIGQPTIFVSSGWEETPDERNASFDKLLAYMSEQVDLVTGSHINLSRANAEVKRDGAEEYLSSEHFDLNLFDVPVNTYVGVELEESGARDKGISCEGNWYIYGYYRSR